MSKLKEPSDILVREKSNPRQMEDLQLRFLIL